MRAVIQRVKTASVAVSGEEVGRIKHGFVVFLGVEKEDQVNDLEYMVNKIAGLRAFEDDIGKMNLALSDVSGELLVVSQFTLFGDCRKGRRPSFTAAADPAKAQKLYNDFIKGMKQQNIKVSTGVFQAKMEVSLLNDGPVTFLLDSKKTF
jgi:D-tyrosyl-tRNA(Tyr) deacylase